MNGAMWGKLHETRYKISPVRITNLVACTCTSHTIRYDTNVPWI